MQFRSLARRSCSGPEGYSRKSARASVSRINTVILALGAGKHPSGVSRVAAPNSRSSSRLVNPKILFLLPQANERFQPQKDPPQHPESSLHRRQLHESRSPSIALPVFASLSPVNSRLLLYRCGFFLLLPAKTKCNSLIVKLLDRDSGHACKIPARFKISRCVSRTSSWRGLDGFKTRRN